jgi:hypothetical protein
MSDDRPVVTMFNERENRPVGWQPLGKMILVRLHTRGSALELAGDVQYNSLADVIGVGREVEQEIDPGDVVMINGPQGVVAHKELGEHVALVPAALVLAKRTGRES